MHKKHTNLPVPTSGWFSSKFSCRKPRDRFKLPSDSCNLLWSNWTSPTIRRATHNKKVLSTHRNQLTARHAIISPNPLLAKVRVSKFSIDCCSSSSISLALPSFNWVQSASQADTTSWNDYELLRFTTTVQVHASILLVIQWGVEEAFTTAIACRKMCSASTVFPCSIKHRPRLVKSRITFNYRTDSWSPKIRFPWG